MEPRGPRTRRAWFTFTIKGAIPRRYKAYWDPKAEELVIRRHHAKEVTVIPAKQLAELRPEIRKTPVVPVVDPKQLTFV